MHDVMSKDYEDYDYFRRELMTSPLTFVKSGICQFAPIGQKYMRGATLERLERTQMSDTPEGYPTLQDLGVQQTRVEDVMPSELHHFAAYLDHEEIHEWEKLKVRDLVPLNAIEENAMRVKLASGKNTLKALGL